MATNTEIGDTVIPSVLEDVLDLSTQKPDENKQSASAQPGVSTISLECASVCKSIQEKPNEKKSKSKYLPVPGRKKKKFVSSPKVSFVCDVVEHI